MNSSPQTHAFGRSLLETVGNLAFRSFILLSLCWCMTVSAQSQVTPSFEVASIKLNKSASGMTLVWFGEVDKVRETNVTVASLIAFAYNLKDGELSGGPGWISSDRYDIETKVPDTYVEQFRKTSSPISETHRIDTLRLMMQNLLADRFALTISKQVKELPVFVLTVSKNGPKLSPPSGRFGMSSTGDGLTLYGLGIDTLVEVLSKHLSRRVVDETGIKDKYDMTLSWRSDASETTAPSNSTPNSQGMPPVDPVDLRIARALEDQLGLKLESRKVSLPVIQVESIKRPSEN